MKKMHHSSDKEISIIRIHHSSDKERITKEYDPKLIFCSSSEIQKFKVTITISKKLEIRPGTKE